MFCGVTRSLVMVRVGKDTRDRALASPRVRPMRFRARPLKNFVVVDREGCRTEAALRVWVQVGLDAVAFTRQTRR
jgi:hypothetical protein